MCLIINFLVEVSVKPIHYSLPVTLVLSVLIKYKNPYYVFSSTLTLSGIINNNPILILSPLRSLKRGIYLYMLMQGIQGHTVYFGSKILLFLIHENLFYDLMLPQAYKSIYSTFYVHAAYIQINI